MRGKRFVRSNARFQLDGVGRSGFVDIFRGIRKVNKEVVWALRVWIGYDRPVSPGRRGGLPEKMTSVGEAVLSNDY